MEKSDPLFIPLLLAEPTNHRLVNVPQNQYVRVNHVKHLEPMLLPLCKLVNLLPNILHPVRIDAEPAKFAPVRLLVAVPCAPMHFFPILYEFFQVREGLVSEPLQSLDFLDGSHLLA